MTEASTSPPVAADMHSARPWELKDRPLFDKMPSGFALHELICDDTGRPANYRFLYVNPAFERLTGLRADAVVGRTVLEVLPGIEHHWIEAYGRVALAGESAHFQNHSEDLDRDFEVTAYQAEVGQFACFITDVTGSTKLQKELLEKERRFQTILDNIPDLVWFKDRESRFISVNEAFGLACGRKPDELVGKSDVEIWPKELAEHYRADDFEVVANGRRKQVVEALVDNDGRSRWIETIKTPVRDGVGEVVGTTGIARDITARKRAEAEREQLYNFFQTSTDLMCIADPLGAFKQVNPAFTQTLGFTESELLSKPFIEFVHPEDRQRTVDEMADQRRRRFSLNFENRYVCKDGTLRWLSWRAYVNEAEGLTYGTARDVTAQKAADEELRLLNRDFVTLLENTSDFIYFKDKNSRVRFCSQAMASLCGYTSWRDMIGKHDLEVFPEETARIYHEEELPVFRDGKPLLNKIDPYIDRQGNRGWVSTNKWPVFDDDNHIVTGIFGISRDITQRRNAEKELERQALRNETLLRSATDGIHILDANGNVIEANEVFCRMLGYTHEEALKLNLAEWDAKWSADELKGQIIPSLLKEPHVFETKHRRRDRRIIDVEVSAAGVEIEGQWLLFAASRDITERKQMEKMLRLREEKIEGIFLSAPVGIAVLANRVITVANDRFCETIGYSREEVVGMPTRKLYLSDEEYQEIGDSFYAALGQKLAHAAETQFRCKDGRIVDVLLTMAAMNRKDPRAEATFMVMDITERKRAEEELKRYAAELAEANKLKDIFTDILRHDIMNPVSAIKAGVQLMAERETEPRATRLLNSMQRSIANLIEMTENAANFARVAAIEDMKVSKSDVANVLRDLLDDFDSQLREKDVGIELVAPQESWADLNPIVREVFANLISNAIKYGPAHSKIELRVDEEPDSWLVSVKDYGEGISDENKERIFNRFERISKQGVKGSGLGLAIAHRIVAMHRGKIWVEDNPQGGCVFLVRLPKKGVA